MEDENLFKPSINSTPADICEYAICKLSEFWDDLLLLTKGPDSCVGVEGFIEDIFSKVWEDGDTGEKFNSSRENPHAVVPMTHAPSRYSTILSFLISEIPKFSISVSVFFVQQK